MVEKSQISSIEVQTNSNIQIQFPDLEFLVKRKNLFCPQNGWLQRLMFIYFLFVSLIHEVKEMKTKEENEADKCRKKTSPATISLPGFSTSALVILILLFTVVSVSAAEYQVHEGESIQAVINIANPGDTIIVHNGTYTENVVVNKSNLTIRSANGSAVTIVQSNRTDTHVFNITDQNNVTLEGFTVRDASAAPSATKDVHAMGQTVSALVLPPENGSIYFTSDPLGASVCLDGQCWGGFVTTPTTIPNVEPGIHTLELHLGGYEDWSEEVQVTAGETLDVHATLTSTPTPTGSIRITSEPSGATIELDGKLLPLGVISATPATITGISPGWHSIKLTLEGYKDWSDDNVQVTASETTTVHATLTPTTGSISVTSDPSGAMIYRDNKREGKTPRTITDVPPGAHTIKLILDDYDDWLDDNVQVTADETTPVHATLTPTTGSIKVTSDPSGATVSLDDDDWWLYETPCTIKGVEPGDGHSLKITLKCYQDWLDDNVQVAVGETTHIHATLTPIPTTGSIYVTSKPSDAKIYLDNTYNGKTPYTITGVSPAYHAIKLTLVGYQDWSTNLQVNAGETTPVHATLTPCYIRAGIYMSNASNCVIKNSSIINCGQGILIASGSDNRIERNIIRANTIVGTGVRLESGAINTEIHKNCFIDNVPQAWDDGTGNDWVGNYWSPSPGEKGNYNIPGAARTEDTASQDVCPLIAQPA